MPRAEGELEVQPWSLTAEGSLTLGTDIADNWRTKYAGCPVLSSPRIVP